MRFLHVRSYDTFFAVAQVVKDGKNYRASGRIDMMYCDVISQRLLAP